MLFPLRPFLVSKCLPVNPLGIIIRQIFAKYDPHYQGDLGPAPWDHVKAIILSINPPSVSTVRWTPALLDIKELSLVVQNIRMHRDELIRLMSSPSKADYPLKPTPDNIMDLKCALLGYGMPIACHFICKKSCTKRSTCTGFHADLDHIPQDMVQLAGYKLGNRLCNNGTCCQFRQVKPGANFCSYAHLSEEMLIGIDNMFTCT